MVSICKIFRFEAAHAIHHYPGKCAHIHGHSYELHVTVQAKQPFDNFIDGLGIIIDFKELKALVQNEVIETLDHKLILSKAYLSETKGQFSHDELVVFDVEPTAENLLLFLRMQIISALPEHVRLHSLKLWETRDSYAEWLA
ncbi:MAG: 6-carboxytetrahydropterin synthase [Bacteroidota bacterium]